LVGTGMIFYGLISQPKASLSALVTVGGGAIIFRLWEGRTRSVA